MVYVAPEPETVSAVYLPGRYGTDIIGVAACALGSGHRIVTLVIVAAVEIVTTGTAGIAAAAAAVIGAGIAAAIRCSQCSRRAAALVALQGRHTDRSRCLESGSRKTEDG